MKRFASHFLFLPGYGYLKQYAIEMEEECVTRIFPLTEEVENTEWLPGVIALLRNTQSPFTFNDNQQQITAVPQSIEEELPSLIPYLFSPFDFTTMQPAAETRHRQLR